MRNRYASYDEYGLRHLPQHLVRSGRGERLREMLFDFDWLQAKVSVIDPQSLIEDYNLIGTSLIEISAESRNSLKLIQDALRLSAHILTQDSTQLAGQLLCRLADQDMLDIQTMLRQVQDWKETPWLHPLTTRLTPPGGPLIRTLAVAATPLAITPDGRRAVAVDDRLFNDWAFIVLDLEHGSILHTLKSRFPLGNKVVTPDGRRGIFVTDRGLGIIDLEHGGELRTYSHPGHVKSAHITPDGRLAITEALCGFNLKVWDLERGEELRTLRHAEEIKQYPGAWFEVNRRIAHLSLTPDGRYGISCSRNSELVMWDLERGEKLSSMQYSWGTIDRVELIPGGKRVILSASHHIYQGVDDYKVAVLDLEQGVELLSLWNSRSYPQVEWTSDKRLAICASGGQIEIWDLVQGTKLPPLIMSHAGDVRVKLSSDNRLAISIWSNELKVWDLEHRGEIASYTTNQEIVDFAITPDGQRGIFVSGDGTVTVRDLRLGTELHAPSSLFTLGQSTYLAHPTGIVITPNGQRAICTFAFSTSGTWFKVLDLKRMEFRDFIDQEHNTVRQLVLTPDGRRVVLASNELIDYLVTVWDLEQERKLYTSRGRGADITAIAVAPDGHRAISALDDVVVTVWDLETGSKLHALSKDGDWWVKTLTLDGQRAFYQGSKKELIVLDLKNGKELYTLPGTRWVGEVMTTDGWRGLSTSEGRVTVWDLYCGEKLHTLPGSLPSPYPSLEAAAMMPDGWRAISPGRNDYDLRVWNLENGEQLCTLAGHSDSIVAVAMTPDGHFAISGSKDNAVIVWDLERAVGSDTSKENKSNWSVGSLQVLSGGREIISAYELGSPRIWDRETGKELRSLDYMVKRWRCAYPLILTPDSGFAVSVSRSWNFMKCITLWDLKTEEELWTKDVSTALWKVWITPDGKHIVALDSKNYDLVIFGLRSGEELQRLNIGHVEGTPPVIEMTPDGRRIVSSLGDNKLKVWDLQNGKELVTLANDLNEGGGYYGIKAIAMMPDGRRVITLQHDSHTVWDIEQGKKLFKLEGYVGLSQKVIVTPDGRWVIGYSDSDSYSQGIIRVWDLQQGKTAESYNLLVESRGPGAPISVTVMPSGQLAAYIWGHTLKVWDLPTGNIITTFTWDEEKPTACTVAPDGKTIIVGGFSGQVHFLRLENIVPGPPAITAWHLPGDSGYAFGCFYCRTWSEVPVSALGTELQCPHCNKIIKLNPFTIEGDWQPIAKVWEPLTH